MKLNKLITGLHIWKVSLLRQEIMLKPIGEAKTVSVSFENVIEKKLMLKIFPEVKKIKYQ